MARASGAVLAIDVEAVPLLEGALELVDGNTPGGGRTNQSHFSGGVGRRDHPLDARRVQLMFDPQTSGGLLVAVAPDAAAGAVAAWSRAGVSAQPVGEVLDPGGEGRNLAVVLR
jgi:selenide,water dikinase